MKKFGLIFSVLILSVIFAGSAAAQTTSKLNVNVPFDFNFGGRTVAAGTYSIRAISTALGSAIIMLDDKTGKTLASVIASYSSRAAKHGSELSFEKVNGQAVLAAIAIADHGFELPGTGSASPNYAKTRDDPEEDKHKVRSN